MYCNTSRAFRCHLRKILSCSTSVCLGTMEKLITDLRSIFDASDNISTGAIRQIMETYKSDPREWVKYVHFDPHKYTRNLVDIGNGKYNLMILCWGPGCGSSIHDHTNSHCFVKVLQGSLMETRFAWPTSQQSDGNNNAEQIAPLKQIGCDVFSVNAVTYMSDQLGLHRMENPSHANSVVTLHLYTPPYDHCKMFDQRTGKSMNANVTFHTMYGEKVDYTKRSRKLSMICSVQLKSENEEKDSTPMHTLTDGIPQLEVNKN